MQRRIPTTRKTPSASIKHRKPKAATHSAATETVRVFDYNGTGRWSREAIIARYADYARRSRLRSTIDLTPVEFASGNQRWVHPVMEKVIEGIEAGDPACTEIGVEFIEEDATFTFGRILKSNTARALRRGQLSPNLVERIRKRVIRMLLDGHVPREYREYAKLLRKVSIGGWWEGVDANVDRANQFVMRYYYYFKPYVVPAMASKEPSAHPSSSPARTRVALRPAAATRRSVV